MRPVSSASTTAWKANGKSSRLTTKPGTSGTSTTVLPMASHSSAPEVFLAAASQRTSRIKLGHGIIQLPHYVNHPARVAERVATLDLISDGRVQFGTGEGSSEPEIGGFLSDRERKRDMWSDAIDAVTRRTTELLGVTADKAAFTSALRRMSIVASDQTHRIRMAFANGSCKLSVQTPDLGEAQEELNVSYEGDPLEIGFNAAYLLEILKYIPTDEVRMTFKAPERAATCEPVGWDDPASYLALVMPLRLVD